MSKIGKVLVIVFSLPSLFFSFFSLVFPYIGYAFGLFVETNKGTPQIIGSVVLLLCSAALFLISNGKGAVHIVAVVSLSVVLLFINYNAIIWGALLVLTVFLLCFEKNKVIRIVSIVVLVLTALALFGLFWALNVLFPERSPISSAEHVSPEGTCAVYVEKYRHGSDYLIEFDVQSKKEADLFLLKIVGDTRTFLEYRTPHSSKTLPEIEWLSENEIRVLGEDFSLYSAVKEVRESPDYPYNEP